MIAVGAIILINYQKGEKKNIGLGLILLLLTGGTSDAMSKVFEELGQAELAAQFLFYTFGSALLFCVAFLIYKKEHPGIKEMFYGMLIGIPNFFSARFLLRSLNDLAAVVVYPTYSVSVLLLVTLTGVICFRERLRKTQWVALAAILAALVLLNI